MLHPGSFSLTVALCMASAVAACAQAREQPPQGLRVQVETVADWSDMAALAARASHLSGLSVRDVAASTTRVFALTLVCPDAPACDAGLQRLTLARDAFTQARIDGRRTAPHPVSPSSAAAR